MYGVIPLKNKMYVDLFPYSQRNEQSSQSLRKWQTILSIHRQRSFIWCYACRSSCTFCLYKVSCQCIQLLIFSLRSLFPYIHYFTIQVVYSKADWPEFRLLSNQYFFSNVNLQGDNNTLPTEFPQSSDQRSGKSNQCLEKKPRT